MDELTKLKKVDEVVHNGPYHTYQNESWRVRRPKDIGPANWVKEICRHMNYLGLGGRKVVHIVLLEDASLFFTTQKRTEIGSR